MGTLTIEKLRRAQAAVESPTHWIVRRGAAALVFARAYWDGPPVSDEELIAWAEASSDPAVAPPGCYAFRIE